MTVLRVHPDDEEQAQARQAVSLLTGTAGATDAVTPAARARLVAGGTEVRVPEHAYPAFIAVLEAFAHGDEVTVLRAGREVTTEQAAAILNVSRPTVVRWIEAGKLPARRAGSHRRILLRDVLTLDETERDRQEDALERFLNLAELPTVITSQPLLAVLDANVLIPAYKGDFLLTAAFLRLYTPVLSGRIFAECRRHLEAGKTGRLDAAEAFFGDQIVSGWEDLEEAMPLSKCPEDRHVLALAVYAGADIVVTDERRLTAEINALENDVLAMTADGFGCELLARFGPDQIQDVIAAMAEKRKRPPQSEEQIWSVLADPVSGLPELAKRYQETQPDSSSAS